MKRTTYLVLIIGTIVCATALNGCIRHDGAPPRVSPPDGYTYLNSTNIDCDDCHAVQHCTIENGSGRHAHLNCTFCHIQHGYQPDCLTCHPDTHGTGIQGCEICHPDPHAPELRINDSRLNDSICQPCHLPQYDAIDKGTGRHSKLKCDLCHVQHGYLPTCADCHGLFHGSDVTDCDDCHDPHVPESIEFDYGNNSECARCHHSVIEETFAREHTKHAELSCYMCHPLHAETMMCIDCHPGHSSGMGMRDCRNCHRIGHVPTDIMYSPNAAETKSGVCVDCHAKSFNMMYESESEHRYIECVECHPAHGAIVACDACHIMEPPHGTECGACHGFAHDTVP